MGIKRIVSGFWRIAVFFGVPLVVLPLPFVINTKLAGAAYTLLVNTIFYMVQPVPLAVSSLLPVFLYPSLGVYTATQIATWFIHDSIIMLVSCIIFALGFESVRLHRRVALRILVLLGPKPERLLLLFLTVSAFLSMGISNFAAAVMLLPFARAVARELQISYFEKETASEVHWLLAKQENETHTDTGAIDGHTTDNGYHYERRRSTIRPRMGSRLSTIAFTRRRSTMASRRHTLALRRPTLASRGSTMSSTNTEAKIFRTGVILSVVYGTSIGGLSTLMGAHPSSAFKRAMDQRYGYDTGVNYLSYMAVCIPLAVVALVVTWFLMALIYAPECIKRWISWRRSKEERNVEELIRVEFANTVKERSHRLGKIRFSEASMACFFGILLLQWLFRSPDGISGWEILFKKRHVSDDGLTLLIATLLFVWPKDPRALWSAGIRAPILNWPTVQKRIPWGFVIFICGANVLSEGTARAGFADVLTNALQSLVAVPPWLMMILISVVTSVLTEFTGNPALFALMLPVLTNFAEQSLVNPIYYVLPAALCTMLSFMTPVASLVTAVVYHEKLVTRRELCILGMIPKLVLLALIILSVNTLGSPVYNVHNFPQWANISVGNESVTISPAKTLQYSF